MHVWFFVCICMFAHVCLHVCAHVLMCGSIVWRTEVDVRYLSLSLSLFNY